MSDLKVIFNDNIEKVKELKNISDDDKLYLYKYYKQATIGDVNISKPGFLNFTGVAKWNAWNTVKGITNEEAMNQYIEKVTELFN